MAAENEVQAKAERRKRRQERKERRLFNRKTYGKPSLIFSATVSGILLGLLSSLLYGKGHAVAGAIVGGVLGLVAGIVLNLFVAKRSERWRLVVQYSVCGLLPGFMIVGNPFVIHQRWGAAVGAAVFAALLGAVVAPFIYRMKQKGRYLSFPAEGSILTVMSLLMSFAGDEISQRLIHNRLFYTPHKEASIQLQRIITVMTPKHGSGLQILKTSIGFLVPTLLVILTSLWIGFVLAANRRRPAFGASLVIIGGAIISYIGFKVAPMLFAPGSGLLWAGLVTGLLMIALAITVLYYSQMRVLLGIVTIVLSILSFIGAAGGLIIGGILGIFGGAMIAAWKGEAPTQTDGFSATNVPPDQPLSM